LEGKTDWLYIKQNLKKYLQRSVIPVDVDCDTSNDIVDVVKKFLLARSADYKPETARKYLILQTVWLQFESHRNAKVDISEISFTIMEEFRLYLLTVRNNRNDTIYKMLASLKSIIRWRIKNSFKADATCLELKQKVKTKNEIVTLSEKEIAQLRKLKLEDSLKAIRDSFLFMIFTVQRYSDMQQLKPEQITESCWRFTSIKAGKEIMVPFVGWNKVAFEIASQYDFNFPKYTQQHYNRELKAVCKEAGLNENIILKRFQGSNTILIQNPKWKMISSHTARRTAVTLLLSKGVPPTVIMKLTGHSSIQTMMKYENTTSELLIKALKRI